MANAKSTSGYDVVLRVRMESKMLKDIKKLVRKYPESFYNESHFVRAATYAKIRQLKGER